MVGLSSLGVEMGLRMMCVAAAAILVGTFHLLAGLSGSSLLLLTASALLCLLPYYGVWAFVDPDASSDVDRYLPGVATIAGITLATGGRWLWGWSESIVIDLLAVLLAIVSSATIVAVRLQGYRVRYVLCRHAASAPYHRCPRCGRLVCERTRCWIAAYERCSDCEKYQVPLLRFHAHEWSARLGPRLDSGRCLRCRWTMPDLSASFQQE